MTFSNGYNKLTVGYFVLKLHRYILETPETNIVSCKKGNNRSLLNIPRENIFKTLKKREHSEITFS